MNRRLLVAGVAIVCLAVVHSQGWSHCQIPCGIYDDPVRLALMGEHVTTIEKSMQEITRLSSADDPDWNQVVRWVNNKEHHAQELADIVTFYFMAQRVKPADDKENAAYSKYIGELTTLHEIMIHAMKAKQTTDLDHCTKLRGLIDEFRTSYMGE